MDPQSGSYTLGDDFNHSIFGIRLANVAIMADIVARWPGSGHLATISANIPAKFNCIQYTKTGFNIFVLRCVHKILIQLRCIVFLHESSLP